MTAAEKPRLYLLLAALAAACALAVHLPFASDELLWDDGQYLAGNPFAADCASLGAALNPLNLVRVLPVPMSARPVVNATLAADACGGAGPRGLKATNALLHAGNSALVFFLLLILSNSPPGALFGALAFAVHPAAAETIHIVVFRSHLLGFFFFVSGLLCALFYARRPGASTGLAAAACLLLGALSVETAVVLPLAAALAIFTDSGRAGLRRALPLLAAAVLVLGFYAWFRAPRAGYSLPGSSAGISAPSPLYPAALLPQERPARYLWSLPPPWREVYESRRTNLYTMSLVALTDLRDLLLPYRLSADYSPRVLRSFAEGALPLAGALAALAAGIFLYARRRLTGLALLLIAAGLLPALNLWPAYNLKADRYLYLPLAGAALLAAAGLRYALGSRYRLPLLGAAVLWLAGLGGTTLLRGPRFRDNLALFSAAADAAPASPRARLNLGAARLRAGDCSGGVQAFREAAGLDPDAAHPRLRLAYALAGCGGRAEAAALLETYPPDADSAYLKGLLKLKTDRAGAAALLRSALAASPGRRDFYLALKLAENKDPAGGNGRDKEELRAFREALAEAGLFF
ncbi:MAG: tetratricopeptide repeat protein [Elusimicrobiales bacterium]